MSGNQLGTVILVGILVLAVLIYNLFDRYATMREHLDDNLSGITVTTDDIDELKGRNGFTNEGN